MLTYHQPFDGTVIRWQEDGRYYRLEGTGVSTAALEKMAEEMRVQIIEPQKPEDAGG